MPNVQPPASTVQLQQQPAQRVLIIGPSNIGDAILAGDVIAAAHARFPDAHLTLVVGARAMAVFADDPRVNTLVNADAFDTVAGRLRLALALWRFHPSVVIDLRHTLYPLLLAPARAWRYLRQPPPQVRHMRDRQLWKWHWQAPRAGGRRTAEAPVGSALCETPRDTAHVETLCRRWHLRPGAPLVVVCPGARSHLKRWTAEGMARVADGLIRDAGADVVFSGEPDEEAIVQGILGMMEKPAHSAVGLTTIRQVGGLMRRAHLVITNDSASLHLASAVGVPTLAIFGPTDPAKYGPRAPRQRTIHRRLFCAPCEQAQCRFTHECMRFVSAEEVYRAAVDLLGQGAARPGARHRQAGGNVGRGKNKHAR